MYLSHSYEISGEINQYIDGIDEYERTGKLVIKVQNANNLCGTVKTRKTTPIIPFIIDGINCDVTKDCAIGKAGTSIYNQVIEKLKTKQYTIGLTNQEQINEICSNLINKSCVRELHDMCKINEKSINQWKPTFNDKTNKILYEIKSEVPEDLRTTGMTPGVIGLYIYKNSCHNIPAGTVIIYGETDCKNPYFNNETLPETTGLEVFSMGPIIKANDTLNGCHMSGLTRETSTNEKQMKKELLDYVKEYKKKTKKLASDQITMQNFIRPYYDEQTDAYNEILLNKNVEKNMIIDSNGKKGKIYEAVEKQGYILQLIGRDTFGTNIEKSEFVSYSEIRWTPIVK